MAMDRAARCLTQAEQLPSGWIDVLVQGCSPHYRRPQIKCRSRLRSPGLEAEAKLVRNGFTASTDNRVRLLSLTLLPG
jgi:hypothetical protein